MKVTLPMMVQDQALAGVSKLVEGFVVTTEPYFLDGPVTERVAILDFDEKSGELLPGTPFFPLPPTKKSGARGEYRISEKEKLFKRIDRKKVYQIETRDFNRVSLLATILKAMALFEGETVLGRKLSWAFDGPQLLVIPRAGESANAFYQRESSSLQFFYFAKADGASHKKEWVFTSLSRDIIVHETTHAILDGIAPDLYNASTPQSLAIHEALADLTAVILAFQSGTLSRAVLESTKGEIDQPSQFSQIAEEFGREHSGSDALRELYKPEIVLEDAGHKPHDLSVVLSSALYELMMSLYKDQWDVDTERLDKQNEKLIEAGKSPKFEDTRLSSSGRALALSAFAFASITFGALDFLPPGEVTFADYGRAIIAVQRNLTNSDFMPMTRRKLAKKIIGMLLNAFEKRGITLSQEPPLLITIFDKNLLDGIDLEDLAQSDWVAYQFANENRELLSIPPGIPFAVSPRYTAKKRLNRRPKVLQEQLFFKVSWTETEETDVKRWWLPKQRRLVVGTTLVIDVHRRRPLAVLHTDQDPGQRAERDKMLGLLLDRDLLRFGSDTFGPHEEQLDAVIHAKDTAGALKLSGVARMLHITND